ncbi:MAG: YlxR family protein [Firmicutes bacterium]|nr:YlxR family protein [Bacillota bacterium]
MEKHIPYRRCIGCMESKPQIELVRIVLDAANSAVLDESGNMPGRGAYICKSQDCIEKAIKKRAFSRAFRREVKIDSIRQGLQNLKL